MITKQKVNDSFKADGLKRFPSFDWSCLSTDVQNLPTENIATNDKCLVLDTGKGYYFDGIQWQPIGG